MGWEKRGEGGKRLVYYRKKRIDGRVVSIYCGSGERGRAAEREDLERREVAKRRVPNAAEAEVLQTVSADVLRDGELSMPPLNDSPKTSLRELFDRCVKRREEPRRYRSLNDFGPFRRS